MENRWSDQESERFLSKYAETWGEDLALRTYTSRLLGSDPALVLHGGGNSSVKGVHTSLLGEKLPAIHVKASGFDMATIEPEGHPGLDLTYLKRLRKLDELTDAQMKNELRTHLFDASAPTPSIETLVHAFLPARFIDHTHSDAVLALTNQAGGEEIVRKALGEDVLVIDYYSSGFKLAKATATAFESDPGARAMVWLRHGIITWGETARESNDSMIELVGRAEAYAAKHATKTIGTAGVTPLSACRQRWTRVAPILRGLLTRRSGATSDAAANRSRDRVVLVPLIDEEVVRFVDSPELKELALSPPLTADYLIRTKAYPLWVDSLDYDNETRLTERLRQAIASYTGEYEAYLTRNAGRMDEGLSRFDPDPRVVLLPGVGCACAGPDIEAAAIARDITRHTLKT